jgi:hypothetical protein
MGGWLNAYIGEIVGVDCGGSENRAREEDVRLSTDQLCPSHTFENRQCGEFKHERCPYVI